MTAKRVVTGATKARISRSLARSQGPTTGYDSGAGRAVKRLTAKQKSWNIQQKARTKRRAGAISTEEYKRRMGVSGRLRGELALGKPAAVQTGDMNSALAAMLARSSKPGHQKLATKMRG